MKNFWLEKEKEREARIFEIINKYTAKHNDISTVPVGPTLKNVFVSDIDSNEICYTFTISGNERIAEFHEEIKRMETDGWVFDI